MRIVVMVEGRELPCAPSMGAMLRFKELTGKEINEIDVRSVSELATYLYCCVASACSREKIEFDMKLMEFADRVSPEDMAAWQDSITREARPDDTGESGGEEKKSPPASLIS